MEAPTRSRWSVVPPIFGLAMLQQLLNIGLVALLLPTQGRQHDGIETAIFVIGSALLNTTFYCAAWFGILGAPKAAGRLRRVYVGGMAAALFFFTLACMLLIQVDPKGPFGSYAQVAVLVATLASAFKLDDARGPLAPIKDDPLKPLE